MACWKAWGRRILWEQLPLISLFFLMLAFPYEGTDSASMGGGTVKFGSHQILCVPCWVTVTSVPGSFLSTVNLELQCVQVLGLLIVVNSLTVQVNILMMAFPETQCFWKATQRICCSSTGLCHFCLFLAGKGETWYIFLVVLVQMKCTPLTVMLKCFL